MDHSIAARFLPRLTPDNAADPVHAPDLLIDSDGPLRVVYAPFDHVETRARLVVVGITPGKTQAVNAAQAALTALRRGPPVEDVLAIAKATASFSGPAIRNNLVAMLDAIGVARHLGVATTRDLFRPDAAAVHFTSALRYPVFVNSRNYAGTPDIIGTPLLRRQVETHLAQEARALPDAIWLPLGPVAQAATLHLAALGHLERSRVLAGLPHPSGANAERVAVFLGRKRPEDASTNTNPGPLLTAFARLRVQIGQLDKRTA